jgi:hypothetical protein
MPHKTVRCPKKGCRNMKQPDAEMCNECRLKERHARMAERKICPGYEGHPCGLTKDPDSTMCKTCRQLKEGEERDARQREERERQAAAQARLAAGQPTPEDKLRDENTELRQQVTHLETTLRSYRGQRRIEDRLVDKLAEFIERNPYRPQLRPYAPRGSDGKATAHEMLALVSDAHYPEVVDPAATMGLAYDGDICMKRMQRLRDVIIRYKDLRASAYPTRKLSVAVNGDMLSGVIHEELEVTNAEPMGEAMVKMAYALFDMGTALVQEFPVVEFVVMPGNHPRFEKKPRFKNKWNNWEWVMGKFLQGLATASGLTTREKGRMLVTVPKDIVHRHEIFGFKVGISHGDSVKAQSFAGIPWYAMKQRQDAIQALLKDLGQPQLDMLVYGHWHRLIYDEGQGCSLVINGSIKGGDEMGIATRYSAPRAVQGLLTFHPKHGMTDLSRINLDQVR